MDKGEGQALEIELLSVQVTNMAETHFFFKKEKKICARHRILSSRIVMSWLQKSAIKGNILCVCMSYMTVVTCMTVGPLIS